MGMLKRIIKIAVFGVCLGLILVIIQNVFQIDEGVFMHGYWIAAPGIVLAAVLFNIVYNTSYQRKMLKAKALLDEGRAQEYIAETEKLLQTAKGENLRNILGLNLAAGYMEMKEFGTAIGMLEELRERHLPSGAVKMILNLNLCVSYFYDAQYEKAVELYDRERKVFDRYRNDKRYGGNIAALDALAAERRG